MLKLIPSNAPRFVPCPGSVGMEAPFLRSPAHPVTAEGIALHWACERVLMSWLPVNNFEPLSLSQFRGNVCPENGVIISDEMVWAGGVYLQKIWNRAHVYPEGLQIEKQLSAHHYIEKFSGRTDALWKSQDGKWLSIYDLKFGYGIKHAFENWQLISYALAALDERTEMVELVLVQPRGASAAQPVKVWPLTIEKFWTYGRTLIDSALEARGPNPRTVAGAHCRYCKAATQCGTQRAAGMNALDTGLAGVDVELSEPELAHEIELLDRAKDLVRARLDALEALAIARIQAGKPVPGYSYRKTQGNRSWTLPPAQIVAVGNLFEVDVEERKPLSPNQAEGRGLPRQMIDFYTERKELAAKLTRVDRNAAREVFQK